MATFTTRQNLQNNALTLTFTFNVKSQDNRSIQRQSECVITAPSNLTITPAQANEIEMHYTNQYCIHAAMTLETHSKNYSYAEYMAALQATPPKTLSTAVISRKGLEELNDHAMNAHRGALRAELEANKIVTGSKQLALNTELKYTI
jgi:hypothetical protein|tara:strand:+ start:134609 stop:135049 length:441 start_codon:yes stop_codon:yes gene_type:complete